MLSHILSTCFRTASHRSSIYKNYIVLAIGILFFLSGCEIKSAQVERMEKLASIMQLATGREVGRRLQNAEPGLTGPTIAQILIEYEPINNYTKKDVYNEIVAILKKNNWKGSEPNPGHDYFEASLELSPGDYSYQIDAKVLIQEDKNLVHLYMEDYHY